jgi:hypothetical protein
LIFQDKMVPIFFRFVIQYPASSIPASRSTSG